MGKITTLLEYSLDNWQSEYAAYQTLKNLAHKRVSKKKFSKAWRGQLKRVSSFVFKQRVHFNKRLFEELGITDITPDECQIGLKQAELIKKHKINDRVVLELQLQFQQLSSFIKVNYQVLLASVRKYMKHTMKKDMFMELVPELVASNLNCGGLPMDPSAHETQRKSVEQASLFGLHESMKELPSKTVNTLVAHRGFHDGRLGLHRPLENTLTAFEHAWSSGIQFCECDVHTTKDGHLVVHHDATLKRLALDENNMYCNTNISDLTLEEFLSVPLKNGSPSATLLQILESACRFGTTTQLVIEMKAGPTGKKGAAILNDMLTERPEFAEQVAIIMSFDLEVMEHVGRITKNAQYSPMPKLMFLVATPENEYVEAKDFVIGFDAEKYNAGELDGEVQSWLEPSEGVRLDGIYLEYDPLRFTSDEGKSGLLRLSKECVVGVWKNQGHPDTLKSIQAIEQCGVSYHNSDFPPDFIASTL